MIMKVSENPVFDRELRKLLEYSGVYNIGLNLKIIELIKKYEENR